MLDIEAEIVVDSIPKGYQDVDDTYYLRSLWTWVGLNNSDMNVASQLSPFVSLRNNNRELVCCCITPPTNTNKKL